MTLNLSQMQVDVKRMALVNAPRPNVKGRHPVAINEAYRQLKALGWHSTMQLHPTDRTPVFEFNGSRLWRDPRGEYDWLMSQGERVYGCDGDLEAITDEARGWLQAGADEYDAAAADIAAQYGTDWAGRLERAAELARGTDDVWLTKYGSRWADGQYKCDCPDRRHRNITAPFGAVCKHTLALMIRARVADEALDVSCVAGFEAADQLWQAGHPADDYGLEARS